MKTRGKANLSGSRKDDEGGATQKLAGVERISSRVREESHCDTHGGICTVLDGGIHVCFIPGDFAKWATIIVS